MMDETGLIQYLKDEYQKLHSFSTFELNISRNNVLINASNLQIKQSFLLAAKGNVSAIYCLMDAFEKNQIQPSLENLCMASMLKGLMLNTLRCKQQYISSYDPIIDLLDHFDRIGGRKKRRKKKNANLRKKIKKKKRDKNKKRIAKYGSLDKFI